ncbi:DMT family transporter [Streptomyces sp. NPDC048172]|uniref:EamA family transporter n=1 Tax=Streptomyces sp. NPDC048172 TaxID=3365505 RepID=UPI00371A7001
MTRTATVPVPASSVPAPVLFGVSAVFHYVGPALAVLLFAHLDVLGVAWLRIAGAAVVLALWRRPWRTRVRPARGQWRDLAGLGLVLAAMNSVFYLAVARLPLSTVAAIEFLGVIGLAAAGARTVRNVLALCLAVGGVLVLTDIRLTGEPLGFGYAFANSALFVLYVVLGHRAANAAPAPGVRGRPGGIDRLAVAMVCAALVATPAGIGQAWQAFTHPVWLLAGVGVGLCSSVIPYVADQLAMARLRRSTFALMLTILPATATAVGLIVLAQRPTVPDLAGIALVAAGIAVHQQARPQARTPRKEPS